jgi:hypothetical protein
VGSARAAKVRFNVLEEYLTIWLRNTTDQTARQIKIQPLLEAVKTGTHTALCCDSAAMKERRHAYIYPGTL